MYIQCVDCQKKFRVKSGAIPAQGAVVSCAGCGNRMKVAARDNLAGDRSKIPVNKRKHKKEVKWYTRTQEIIRGFGFERGSKEYNMMFWIMREVRKRFGITFLDFGCKVALLKVDRALAYNVLDFSGQCCIPPVEGYDSCIGGLIEGMAEIVQLKDSSDYFTMEQLMRVHYENSFPSFIHFGYGTQFETSYGEVLYGNAARVDITIDALRELPVPFNPQTLPDYARIEIARFPVSGVGISYHDRMKPGLHVHVDPDPDIRCADPVVTKMITAYS